VLLLDFGFDLDFDFDRDRDRDRDRELDLDDPAAPPLPFSFVPLLSLALVLPRDLFHQLLFALQRFFRCFQHNP